MEGSSFQLSISNKVHNCTRQASDDSNERMEDTDGRREESDDDLDEDMEDPNGLGEESGDTNGTKEEAFYDPSHPTVLFTGNKPYRDLSLKDLQGVEFKTVEEAEKFYSYYSLVHWNRYGTIVGRRGLVCSKQGQQKESGKERECMEQSSGQKQCTKIRRVTRGNCLASFAVKWCPKKKVYYASKFCTEQNHSLARVEHRQFLRSHRHVPDFFKHFRPFPDE